MDPKQPTSFTKSLFFGQIPEEMVIPYPRIGRSERAQVKELLGTIANISKQIDSHAIDATGTLPPGLIPELGKARLLGLSIPTELGGLGLSATASARVAEELARVDASVSVLCAGHSALGTTGLLLHGNNEQRRRLLPQLASGEKLAAFALTEPGSGSDAASVAARAVPNSDGSFTLDGDKQWIVNGGRAQLYTVFAQTEVEKGGEKRDRITAFLVERGPGVESGPTLPTLGVRAASLTGVRLRGVRVGPENILGRVGGGFKVAMGVLNTGRLGSAAAAVGAAKEAMGIAIAHSTRRSQFGRPIGGFGLIKDKLGCMMMDLFAAESMVYLTTGLIDRGVVDYSLESAICKVYASEMLRRVVHEASNIVAGGAYIAGHPLERHLRDARAHLIFQGTNEVLRCFIALAGMTGPGERLAQLADFIKWPLKGYGLAIDFVVDKLKQQYVGGGALDKAHAMLKREAVYFEDAVPELAKQVEKSLRRHGKEISEMQFVQRRVADFTIDLYLMAACIARTTAAIQDKGAPVAEREAKLCRAACGRAVSRIRDTIRHFDDNDDELMKALAKDASDAGSYDFDLALE